MEEKQRPKSMEVGWAVRAYRISLGLTRREFADLCEVSLDSVERWEHGECKPPFSIIEKIIKKCRR